VSLLAGGGLFDFAHLRCKAASLRRTRTTAAKGAAKGVDILHVMDVEYLHLFQMPKPSPEQKRIELLQGTLDMLILQTLRWGTQHGYGISQAIRAGTDDVLQVETGSLYPALHRLERRGWIKSEWKRSANKQRAKYYSLTGSGKKQLVAEETRWNKLTTAIRGFMHPAEGEEPV